jgi:hypothetical protein
VGLGARFRGFESECCRLGSVEVRAAAGSVD